jgi:hypothetical protein
MVDMTTVAGVEKAKLLDVPVPAELTDITA